MPLPRRVIHYYPRFLDHRSGVTESIAGWALIASRSVAEVEVWVAGRGDLPEHRDTATLRRSGVRVRRVPHLGRSNRSYLMKWWTTELGPADVVYVHEGWLVSNALAVWHARRAGATVVAMPHGAYAPALVEAGRDVAGLRAGLERWLLRRVDAVHVFFPSESAEIDTVADSDVRAGVFSNPAPEVAAEERWRGDGDYFVWIGRYDVRHKGLDLLLEGWADLPVPRPRLVLAGPDYQGGRRETEQLVERLGLADDVVLRGSVTGAEKQDLMVGATGYVHSSRWDSCSMVLLEFLARGTPCLVNSSVHAAGYYAAEGIASTFSSPADFPQRIPGLAGAREMGRRAASYMQDRVSAEALQGPYAAWLDELTTTQGASDRVTHR